MLVFVFVFRSSRFGLPLEDAGGGIAAGFLDADELGKPECSENVPPHEARPGTLVLQKGGGCGWRESGEDLQDSLRGRGLALFAFFNTTIQCRMAISRFCFLQKVERACYSFSANGSCVCVWLC